MDDLDTGDVLEDKGLMSEVYNCPWYMLPPASRFRRGFTNILGGDVWLSSTMLGRVWKALPMELKQRYYGKEAQAHLRQKAARGGAQTATARPKQKKKPPALQKEQPQAKHRKKQDRRKRKRAQVSARLRRRVNLSERSKRKRGEG